MTVTNFPFTGCIVRPRDGWVLQRLAESWSIPGAKVCDRPDPEADYAIYVNYALWKTVGVDYDHQVKIGYFTHREKAGPLAKLFDTVAEKMHACIAMCDRTARHLPYHKTTVVKSSPHRQFLKEKIVLGVVGREYPRKRTGLIPGLRSLPGIEIRYTGGKLPFDQLPDFYRSIDYLLVLSELEGGPLPVLEALAMGKPVIAPDVGWCWDYPVIRYVGTEGLVSILERLVVSTVGWESQQIEDVINGVCAA